MTEQQQGASFIAKPKTLLIVAESVRGGLGLAAFSQAKWFTNNGWRVVLAAPNSTPSIVEDIEVVKIPLPSTARNLREIFRAGHAIRHLHAKNSVAATHCHGIRAFAATLVGGVRSYVTMHHFGSASGDPRFYHSLRRVVIRLIPFAALGAFTGEPSLGMRWQFLPTASPLLTELAPTPCPTGTFSVLWCGRLDSRKRPDIFVEAIARASQVVPIRGVMIGDGELASDVRSLIESIGSPVELLGAVEEVKPWLEKSSAFALFTNFEAASFAVQEAMWVGRPVIVTNLPALQWLVGDVGFTVPNNSEDAAQAMVTLVQSGSGSFLGRRAQDRIRSLLSVDSPSPELAKHYEQGSRVPAVRRKKSNLRL